MSAITRERDALADPSAHLLSIPNHTGDIRIMWDPRNRAEVKTAETAFESAKADGMIAYEVNTETGEPTRTVITKFKKSLGKVIMMTQSKGG